MEVLWHRHGTLGLVRFNVTVQMPESKVKLELFIFIFYFFFFFLIYFEMLSYSGA